MRPKPSKPKALAWRVVKDIRRARRRHFSAGDKIRDLRRESRDLKECVADLTLENRMLK